MEMNMRRKDKIQIALVGTLNLVSFGIELNRERQPIVKEVFIYIRKGMMTAKPSGSRKIT